VVAGLLVGFGSVWGNGCTSGHGVVRGCLGSRSRALVSDRDIMATGFFATVFHRAGHWKLDNQWQSSCSSSSVLFFGFRAAAVPAIVGSGEKCSTFSISAASLQGKLGSEALPS